MTLPRWRRVASSASAGRRPATAAMIARCSGSEACGRPGRSDSWNWWRTSWPFSRSSRLVATAWPEISRTSRCSSWLSAEYFSSSPSATQRCISSPSWRSRAASGSVTRSAALAAHSPSSAIRHSVIATASSRVTARTRAPRFGIRSTSPSAARSNRAARRLARVTPSIPASSSSTRRCPGAISPARIACRSRSTASRRPVAPATGPRMQVPLAVPASEASTAAGVTSSAASTGRA